MPLLTAVRIFLRKTRSHRLRRNELFTNTTVESENKISLSPKISEYKIGHTTYTVKTIFNIESEEKLSDTIQRLIIKDVKSHNYAA